MENLGVKVLKNQKNTPKNSENYLWKNWKFGKIIKIWRHTLNSNKFSPNFGGKIRKNTQNSEKYSKNVIF